MAQATRVYNMPPIDASARHSRRSILGAIAGSAAAAGSIAGLTPAIAAALPADPIYAAIEAHRKAEAAADAAFAEAGRLHQLAYKMVGPLQIEVPNMVESGKTAKALCFWDVEQVIPHEQYPDLNEHYCKLLEDRSAARTEIHGDTDELTEGPADAAWEARGEFAETVPTTLPGLLAMIVYANELAEQDPDAFTDGERDRTLLQTLATAAETLIGRPA